MDEIAALLASMGSECDAQSFIDQPDERWTEAPIESDSGEEDEALRCKLAVNIMWKSLTTALMLYRSTLHQPPLVGDEEIFKQSKESS